jgi:hypothetical protein
MCFGTRPVIILSSFPSVLVLYVYGIEIYRLINTRSLGMGGGHLFTGWLKVQSKSLAPSSIHMSLTH